MIKKLLALILVIIVFATASYFYAVKKTNDYLAQPLLITEPQLITIHGGTSLNRALALMTDQAWLVDDPLASKLLRRFYPELTPIRAGTYQLQPGLSLQDSLALLVSGREFQFSITFIEGSRFSEWRASLAQNPNLQQTLTEHSEADIAQLLGIDNAKLEGLFLAETYHFTKGEKDIDILRRAHRKLNRLLEHEWEHRQPDLPLKTPYEALILASIIEKETAIDTERERVSSVFINRLNKRMRLQTDPTVIYGMGDRYQGRIRRADLREATEYNTYVINGLPPTPIAMAGPASIKAALNPEQSDYLYFVASGHGDHVFSKTLAEHNRAVRAYLQVIRSRQ
ncbi:endolytic transglycosylase MltG [Vibrio sp. V31_P5A7T61]|uniref:endolytic transglycosylase MltG n=1 Tax=unclassified Vibrio TaxID=2614977 RepID=UPI0013736C8D|nr:endolytic transglycosylase MltG [Vibrio sp. V31_P5A7T61]NAX00376.1 endolytic transglycosylase MltG [Vibrio sp. V34_P3A8T189]NAX07361.1 endolytic transglycosylase MltG [Vibrio sp. V40_P2S30T141]NAX62730.1 endolytic transglycosylase MltG [Vibrio sp. V32_P6A28T40]NNN83511.1 endolytic transglycosylase MltG [Vibrio sp. A8-1]